MVAAGSFTRIDCVAPDDQACFGSQRHFEPGQILVAALAIGDCPCKRPKAAPSELGLRSGGSGGGLVTPWSFPSGAFWGRWFNFEFGFGFERRSRGRFRFRFQGFSFPFFGLESGKCSGGLGLLFTRAIPGTKFGSFPDHFGDEQLLVFRTGLRDNFIV